MLDTDDSSTIEEIEEDCIGTLFFALDDIPHLVKALMDILCDASVDVSKFNRDNFTTSIEHDAFREDYFFLIKEKK